MRKPKLWLLLPLFAALLTCSCGHDTHDGLTASAATVLPSPNLDPAALRAQLEQLRQSTKVRGLLATVRSGEQEVLTVALGDSMTDVPATPDMHFRIGGISQTFLGTLLMRLVERGEISLNDTIDQWVPDLLAADKVTVGMLINNTSGYKDYVFNEEFVSLIGEQPFRSFTWDELIAYSVGDGQLDFEPGTRQKYSHTNYSILAKAIEGATGRKMPDLYRELTFQPAGLEHTGYSSTAELPSPVLHSFSSDRGVYEDATFWNPTWTGESGPLYSNLNDLARWLRLHGEGSLLQPSSYQQQIARPVGSAPSGPYLAMGFVIDNGWFLQNPSFNGYSGGYGYFPAQDITVIVFTTQSPDPKSDAQAFGIVKSLISTITPSNPLTI